MAVADLRRLEALAGSSDEIGMNLYEPYDAPEGERRFKLYRLGAPISLSRVLPLLQRMGVEVVDERPYEIDRDDDPATKDAWIYDFGLRYTPIDGGRQGRVQAALPGRASSRLWTGEVESDGFNALVLAAGLTWEQAEILRVYAKYLRQAGTTFSQATSSGC